jgi:hypothetical protein
MHKDEALSLFRAYYSIINPGATIPKDYDVRIVDTILTNNKPGLQAHVKVGDLELTRVVCNKTLLQSSQQYLQDLQEAMVTFFVQHHIEQIQKELVTA